jgi:hypothetical protein
MVRLAEYLADLATLLGEYKSVHFVRLAPGSTQLVHSVEYEAEPKIRERLNGVRNDDGPIEAMRAARSIDKRLAQDNASGLIKEPTGAKILDFPGKRRFAQPEYGPFNQAGTLDGIPIRIGGESDLVPVHLEEPGQKEPHICHATRIIARQVAPYIFSTLLRVEGTARYHRDPDGKWIRDKFTIHSFKELKNVPLSESIGRLRGIKSGLHQIHDPLQELENLRQGKNPVN